MAGAIKTVRPALADFYSSLTDEQKARFNTLGLPQATASCSGMIISVHGGVTGRFGWAGFAVRYRLPFPIFSSFSYAAFELCTRIVYLPSTVCRDMEMACALRQILRRLQ